MDLILLKKEKFCKIVFEQKQITTVKKNLQVIEIMSILVDENIPDVNPGILGCGILIGNLSELSRQSFKKMAQEVTNIYRNSTMFDKYPGELKLEEFDIQI